MKSLTLQVIKQKLIDMNVSFNNELIDSGVTFMEKKLLIDLEALSKTPILDQALQSFANLPSNESINTQKKILKERLAHHFSALEAQHPPIPRLSPAEKTLRNDSRLQRRMDSLARALSPSNLVTRCIAIAFLNGQCLIAANKPEKPSGEGPALSFEQQNTELQTVLIHKLKVLITLFKSLLNVAKAPCASPSLLY